jgi:hypothetical protein
LNTLEDRKVLETGTVSRRPVEDYEVVQLIFAVRPTGHRNSFRNVNYGLLYLEILTTPARVFDKLSMNSEVELAKRLWTMSARTRG